MKIAIEVPDGLSAETVLAVLSDCADHAAARGICAGQLSDADKDAYLGVAYHLRRAIRQAAREWLHGPAIEGVTVGVSGTGL